MLSSLDSGVTGFLLCAPKMRILVINTITSTIANHPGQFVEVMFYDAHFHLTTGNSGTDYFPCKHPCLIT